MQKTFFEKYRDKLFIFLSYDGVPWNNNNAEHAVKAFAKIRDIVRGTFTARTVRNNLVLLSICQTCKYRGVDFFDFMRSGELDLYDFLERRRRQKRGFHKYKTCYKAGTVAREYVNLFKCPSRDAAGWEPKTHRISMPPRPSSE